ncbi:TonB-dependent receptor [Balneolaceae bacterium YR4-1]|uniref:TonB-dependent receptor n=1 Tax=Halalkalibaculum roseum TaxID=2709311 RepID=A0A6M1T532_9BACT|nr:TonB-dependent receptor [Halalkalibaculum roseum]NGP75453.1 TonB-dependent receptor [Halalkalibaculum roseum]
MNLLLKNISIVVLLSLLLLGIYSGKVYAQQQTTLLRAVVNAAEDGNPLPGANVVLIDEETEEVRYYCVTDSDGLCEIRNIRPGTNYLLRVTFVGYKAYRESVSFEAGERKIEQISLETAVTEIEEVRVEERRYITTGEAGVRRIDDVDIARIPSPGVGGDLASYLQTEPGVITAGDRGGNLFIRGGTPEQNLVLVDNMPVFKPFHISNLYSAFPDEIIQNVNMFAGGFGSEYTGATSAVIDVNLRPGNKVESRYGVEASPYLMGLQLEGPTKKNRQSYMLLGRFSTIEQFGPTLTGEDIPVQFYDIMGRYSIQESNVSCNFTALRTQDKGQIVPLRNIDHSWSNTVFGGRCVGFDEEFNYPVEATLGYSHFNNSEGAPDRTERNSSLGQIFMNIDMQQRLFGMAVDYGLGLNFRFYNTELAERFTSLQSFARKVAIVKLYSSFDWSPNSYFSLQPGLATQMSTDLQITFEPRIRMAWRPDGTDRQEISLAAGQYAQLMSGISDERDVGTVFTVLKPIEQNDPYPSALHGILGYQRRFGSNFSANLEGFVKKHENISVSKWDPEVGIEIETALADGLAYGFDLSFQFNGDRFFGSVGYGWSKVEYEAVSGDLGAWIEESIFEYNPPHDQRHKLNTVFSYEIGKFTANARWEFGTGRPYTQIFGFDVSVQVPREDPSVDPGTARTLFSHPYGERLPYYHRLDLSVSRAFEIGSGWKLDTQLGAINTYDRNNVFSFDFNTIQRVDQTPLLPYLSFKLGK